MMFHFYLFSFPRREKILLSKRKTKRNLMSSWRVHTAETFSSRRLQRGIIKKKTNQGAPRLAKGETMSTPPPPPTTDHCRPKINKAKKKKTFNEGRASPPPPPPLFATPRRRRNY